MELFTSTYAHGIMECEHCYIVGMGLCLLSQAYLPSKFYLKAFSIAIFLIDHLAMKQLNYESPYTKITCKTPDCKFL